MKQIQQGAKETRENRQGDDASLFFLHHYDRQNQGDVLSGPYHYFDFPAFQKLSWDREVLKKGVSRVREGDSIIMGGGIYFTRDKPRLVSFIALSREFIGWGLGLDPRLNLGEFVENYTLLGTRERNSELIDDKRVFYVPCASCMNSAFDNIVNKPTREVSIHTNGGFNQRDILRRMVDIPNTTTVSDFEDIIENIMGCESIVTNSYHGAYWGALLGKKVVCIKTDVPKWDGLHPNVAFASVDEIGAALKRAQPVPKDYLEECRSINRKFHQHVMSRLGS